MPKKDSKKKMSKTDGSNMTREEALNSTLADIEKAFGKGAVMKMGDMTNQNIPVVTTGILSIDVALGVGGMPKGRIVEIYGPESSGKTTLALHVVSEVQKLGGVAGYVDAEHALDPSYAKKLGVKIDDLYISQPDNGEQALEICEAMVRSHAIDIVVVDSVAALVPKAEIEGDMGALHVGLQARLMSQALRKLTSFTARSNCIVIFINQLRDKIGVTYGSSETTTGGRALKFYASVRVDIRKSTKIEVSEVQVGNRTNIKITKNKVAPPFKKCEVDMMFGEGISKYGDLLDLGSQLNIVKKSGSWFAYGDVRLGQGRENAKTYIKEHPELAIEIENKAREHFGMKKLEELALPENNLVIDQNDDDDDALDIELIDEDLLADDAAVLVRGEEELVYETV